MEEYGKEDDSSNEKLVVPIMNSKIYLKSHVCIRLGLQHPY